MKAYVCLLAYNVLIYIHIYAFFLKIPQINFKISKAIG